jgi:hypothetical protein
VSKKKEKPYLPIGRPTKLGPAQKEQVYDILARGGSLRVACDMLEVDYSNLKRAAKADPVFKAGIKKATAFGLMFHVDRVRKGVQRWQANAWMLERKFWTEFKNRDRAAMQIQTKESLSDLATPDPTLAALIVPPGAVPPPQPDVSQADKTLDTAEVPPNAGGGVEQPGTVQDDSRRPEIGQD